jgi:hypothetical protein
MDAPHSDERVCLVATRPATFARCQDGVYPAPASYDRTREPFTHMAFYRTAPVSAVTHYARVVARTEQRRGESGPLTAADWEAVVDPFSDAERVVVFELDDLVELDTPVENDTNGVRGAWYCTLDGLANAATLSALATRPTG